jgi:toxin FitB
MRCLLDTCIISELIKLKPDERVMTWLLEQNDSDLYVSALTFGELQRGIEKLPTSRKKEEINNWVENEMKRRFQNRTLEIDLSVAKTWGKIQGIADKKGKPMPVFDSLIAATGIVHGLTVVTRNVADMEQSGVSLFNPWQR